MLASRLACAVQVRPRDMRAQSRYEDVGTASDSRWLPSADPLAGGGSGGGTRRRPYLEQQQQQQQRRTTR